jgi:hypothetical protein
MSWDILDTIVIVLMGLQPIIFRSTIRPYFSVKFEQRRPKSKLNSKEDLKV